MPPLSALPALATPERGFSIMPLRGWNRARFGSPDFQHDSKSMKIRNITASTDVTLSRNDAVKNQRKDAK
jgi:hypothetical protein